jgi:hypothetical protein
MLEALQALKLVLFSLLVTHTPPGYTKFSLEVAADCSASAEECPEAVYSDYYKSWVRKESAEGGKERYQLIANAFVDAAQEVLCVGMADGCVPYPGAKIGTATWSVYGLVIASAAVATFESGFREDVMVGRGRSGKPSKDGGEGRGPGNEACLMQVHPSTAWRFADAPEDLYKRAKNGDSQAREQIAQSLLGGESEQLKACFKTGMRMLLRSRKHCAWAAPDTHWDFAMYSMYGTGNSCTSINDGKTMMRTRMFRNLFNEARVPCQEKTGDPRCRTIVPKKEEIKESS